MLVVFLSFLWLPFPFLYIVDTNTNRIFYEKTTNIDILYLCFRHHDAGAD